MKLYDVLQRTTNYVVIVMKKAGNTKAIIPGYPVEIIKYGYAPDADIIDISASNDTLIIGCDIDSIKGA